MSIYADALAPGYFKIPVADFAKAIKGNKTVEEFIREVFSGNEKYAADFISESKA